MKPSVLYKLNGSEETTQLLNIVRYLYTKGYDIRAENIVERNIPTSMRELPVLMFENGLHLEGIKAIIEYYERETKIVRLLEKSTLFDHLNPDYRITLPYTHRNLNLSD